MPRNQRRHTRNNARGETRGMIWIVLFFAAGCALMMGLQFVLLKDEYEELVKLEGLNNEENRSNTDESSGQE